MRFMSDFVTKIEKKKLKDYTPEELQWCIDNEPGTGSNHQAAAFELQRRQMKRLEHPHWVIWATFVVCAIAAIAGVILLFQHH